MAKDAKQEARARKRQRDAEYYQRNRERIIQKASAYQKKHRDAKNRNNRKWRDLNPEKMNSAVQDWRRRNPEANMLHGARNRALSMGIEFDLELADIVIPTHCPVFGFPLERGAGKKHDASPSLDRKDNTRGYTRDNIVVVSWLANRLKNNATIDQLKAIVRFYEAQAEKIS